MSDDYIRGKRDGIYETQAQMIKNTVPVSEYQEMRAKYNEYFNKYIDLIKATLWTDEDKKTVFLIGELTAENREIINLFHGMSESMQKAVTQIMLVTQETKIKE